MGPFICFWRTESEITRPTVSISYHDLDDQASTAAMEVDDGDPLELMNEVLPDSKPFDAVFFNSFEDDFDDNDIA
ncbi:hypothetical protein SUGI_0453990 [Cryptomeria japonica]|uniref:small acidic protein 1 n=1 Tax=Cryptomeria japonica TaxID=3369 RepID=UPI002408BCB1|nr:small acidic protein 1 [Cryptomeria japonica]XP_057847596.2 small acidic protein 1 [Cryptomeria japonica]XP_057847597.2 small acidic protein 1 [Cryptomeria japonica]XP_057847598.2 small acidic protein 1 [Cryptomeria japonica]XP_057847599.2 small acidic protein 1 [Cryptomeria japonica]XP_057847600.2 small acidic protein 1 [Cryptomeria japonica]XP_059077038.1 small acidic protein 1 [Cryptomeria japonica]GLJ23891.1 hypothetical protein SUGI_0453990 [Cryptomeria japonica]